MDVHAPAAIARGLEPFDFHEFAAFNDHAFAVYRGTLAGPSAWEIHRDTDEWLMVLEGTVSVEVLTDEDRQLVTVAPGQCVVVPRGRWHRHVDVRDAVELYFTPGGYEESDAEDPRVADDA